MTLPWQRLWWWILASIKVVMLKTLIHRNYVLLSSGRSGSTLFTQLLNCHPQVLANGELLNREELKRNSLLTAADTQTLSNYILARLLPSKLWISYTGFKLFNEQLEYCKLSLGQLLDDLCSPLLIILYRKNLLDTYVSLKIAFQTDIWYCEEETNPYSVVVDWDNFQQYVKTERMRWRSSLSATEGMKKIFVSFEELTENQDETMRKVFAFLNIKKCIVGVNSVRQNPLPLAKKITNYEEIMGKVKESGLSLMLTADRLL